MIVTGNKAVSLQPILDVQINCTEKVPVLTYVLNVLVLVDVLPSPKSQLLLVIFPPTILLVLLKATVCEQAEGCMMLKPATGLLYIKMVSVVLAVQPWLVVMVKLIE